MPIIKFNGLEGELNHVGEIAPRLIRLGDGSIWSFDKYSRNLSTRQMTWHYEPAVIETFSWVHPSPIGATENIGSVDTQTPEEKGRKLEHK